MWSFRTVLTSTLVALQVVALLAILALTYFASQNVLLSYAEQLTQRVADDTTTFTQNFLNPADDAAALSQRLAESPVLGTSDRPALERYFYEILRSRIDFAGIFYGAADGSFIYVSRDTTVEGAQYRVKRIATQPTRTVELVYLTEDLRPVSRRRDDADTYDPRTRPWYVKASMSREVVWTDPYIFFSSQRPGITVATPVRADDRLGMRGAVGIDIEIHALSKFLDGLRIGERGSAAIVSQSGEVIAHRDSSFLLAEDVSGGQRFARVWEIDDPALAQAVSTLPGGLASVKPGETRLTRFEANGENWRGAVKRLAGSRTPWAVVTYLPESDILGPIHSVRNIGIAVVAGVAALTALLGVLLARALTRPLGALASQAERISEGDFGDIPLPSMWTKELAGTRQAMRRATSWLRDYRRENETLTEQLREAGRVLERRVEERTEELEVANRGLEKAHGNAEMLTHELDHRVKNLFAITASLVTLAAKHATTPMEAADEARGRINALARAHADTQSARETQLAGIVTSVLKPYAGIDEVKLTIEGDPVTVSSSSVTPLGLILYELATNAAKYGALRGSGGVLEVRWSAAGDGAVRMVWAETPTEPPTGDDVDQAQHTGFGSVMLDAMASRLNAGIQRQISPEGLRVILTMEKLEEHAGPRPASIDA